MTPRPGVVIDGRWELGSRIAVGGMGEVWAAHDRSETDRPVAVKVLRPEFAGEQLFLDRIAAEARNSLDLDHPGIARTYASGRVEGLGYLVMELVDGEPLSAVLKREGTLTPRTVLDLVAQTADALAAAHAAGVVHRDIKPANLLLRGDGVVKLTDFGISLGTNQAPMTAAGMVMGTAQYLPPEQAMGRAATGAGDVYALGIIAYESLVGHRPFTGTTQVDIAFAHVTEPLPPLPGSIDLPLRSLVEQMLAKDPAARPRSATVVARRARELIAQLDTTDWDPSLMAGAWGRSGVLGERSATTATPGSTATPSTTTAAPGTTAPGTTTAAPGTTAPGTTAPTAAAPEATPDAGPDAPSSSASEETALRTRRRRGSGQGAHREGGRRPRRRTVLALVVVLMAMLVTLAVLIVGNLGESAALGDVPVVLLRSGEVR